MKNNLLNKKLWRVLRIELSSIVDIQNLVLIFVGILATIGVWMQPIVQHLTDPSMILMILIAAGFVVIFIRVMMNFKNKSTIDKNRVIFLLYKSGHVSFAKLCAESILYLITFLIIILIILISTTTFGTNFSPSIGVIIDIIIAMVFMNALCYVFANWIISTIAIRGLNLLVASFFIAFIVLIAVAFFLPVMLDMYYTADNQQEATDQLNKMSSLTTFVVNYPYLIALIPIVNISFPLMLTLQPHWFVATSGTLNNLSGTLNNLLSGYEWMIVIYMFEFSLLLKLVWKKYSYYLKKYLVL